MKRASISVVGLVFVLATCLASPAFAQQGGAPGGAGGAGGGGRGRFDPSQFRQMMLDRVKETLAVSDADWKTLQPAVEKVLTVQRDAMGGMRGMRGMRGGDRGGDNAAAAQPTSDVEAKAKDLQTVLDNKDAKPEEIKAKLAALRDARAKARDALAAARKELTELLTQRQEATLVEMGILE
jgi:hypothetical protein